MNNDEVEDKDDSYHPDPYNDGSDDDSGVYENNEYEYENNNEYEYKNENGSEANENMCVLIEEPEPPANEIQSYHAYAWSGGRRV